MSGLNLVEVRASPNPSPFTPFAIQHEGAGRNYCAVANTAYGTIPGKAQNNTCWYSYGGKEYTTHEFSWVECPGAIHIRSHKPPFGALAVGFQKDGAGTLYAAIARTNHGNIPGKAKDDTCWYPYGGIEHNTKDFTWVTLGLVPVQQNSSPLPTTPFGIQ